MSILSGFVPQLVEFSVDPFGMRRSAAFLKAWIMVAENFGSPLGLSFVGCNHTRIHKSFPLAEWISSLCFELLSLEFVVMVDVCLYLGWYAGIGQFVQHFAEPGDPEYAPPVTKGETPVLRFLYICPLFACCDAVPFYRS